MGEDFSTTPTMVSSGTRLGGSVTNEMQSHEKKTKAVALHANNDQ